VTQSWLDTAAGDAGKLGFHIVLLLNNTTTTKQTVTMAMRTTPPTTLPIMMARLFEPGPAVQQNNVN